MDMKDLILRLCEKKGTNYSNVAKQMGTTKQNICNKFATKKFYINDIEKIAEVLGYELKIQFIDKETKEVVE